MEFDMKDLDQKDVVKAAAGARHAKSLLRWLPEQAAAA